MFRAGQSGMDAKKSFRDAARQNGRIVLFWNL